MRPACWNSLNACLALTVAMSPLAAAADEVLVPQLDAQHADAWLLRGGRWRLDDGELEQLEFERPAEAILTGPAFDNFSLSVDFNIRATEKGARAAAVLFRATGTRTYYWLRLDSANGIVSLFRARPASTWNGIKSRRAEIAQNAWHTVRIECRGPSIRVTLDDQQLFEAQDQRLSAGRVGLAASQAQAVFRNLKIEGQPIADPEPLASESLPYQVISRGGPAGPYQAFPDVCRTAGGDLMCVFYSGYGHVSLPNDEWPRGGRICYVRSADEGRTWSQPALLFDGPQDDRDPHIAATSDGTLWCSFFQYRKPDDKPEFDTCLVRSTDGGRTWDTEPRVLVDDRWACSAPVREMPDGALILGVYTADDATAYGAVLRSTDAGASWSEPVAIDPESGVRLDAETDVIRLRDGRLFAALRGDRVKMHFATSPDGGLTWSSVEDIGFAGHCPHLTRLTGGEILLAHRLPDTALHISRDEGRTWQGPHTIDTVIGAYASTVELADRSVLVVYYEEGVGSAIRAARFCVTDEGIEMLRSQ